MVAVTMQVMRACDTMPPRARRASLNRPSLGARVPMLTRVCRLVALVVVSLGVSQLPARAQAGGPDKSRHVIVISLDGFAAYALADATLPLPNLRALAKAGVMAEGMRPVNPTVTWPNHTSIVTGVGPDRHGLLYNGLPVRRTPGEAGAAASGPPVRIEPHVDQPELVQAPTVYDIAHKAGLTTAEVDWVAIEHAPTITWSFSEFAPPDAPVVREMVAAGKLTEAEVAAFRKAPITFRDEIWTRAGEHIITTHKPNLLLFHLLTTDSTQHQYGARSLGGNTALVLADAQVGRLVAACRAAGILDRTTFVIVSDHGFKTYKKRIRPNVVLKEKGLGDAAWAISEGGTAMVYVTPPADKAKTVEAMTTAFTGVEGISEVLSGAALAKHGYPSPEKSPRMAELVLAAKDGYAFDGAVEGDVVGNVPAGANPGSHGFLNTDPDMRAIFIASGAGVKPGATLGVVDNLDVAPTIAHWLGLEMPNIAGKPLNDIVQPVPAARGAR